LDVSKFRVGDWVLVIAGAVMLVLGLALNWATIHANGRNYGGARNAVDYPFTGGLAWLLTVGAGVITFLLAAQLMRPGKAPWTRLVLGATALATLLMLLRLLLGGGADQRIGNQDVSLGRGAGIYVALLAAAAALVGAVMNLRAEGDSVQAIASSFSGASRRRDGQLPPPPPRQASQGDVPPPPA
jgi:hypothetical protein